MYVCNVGGRTALHCTSTAPNDCRSKRGQSEDAETKHVCLYVFYVCAQTCVALSNTLAVGLLYFRTFTHVEV